MSRPLMAVLPFILIACASPQRLNQDKAIYHMQMGTAALMQGNNPVAIAELSMAQDLDPESAIVQNNLGLAYLMRERLALAEVHIRKAIDLRPDYTDAKNNLGRVLIERGQFKEAITELQLVTQDLKYQFPEKPLVNIGMAYFKMGDFKNAELNFIAAIGYQKENCLAQSYLGRCFYETKNYTKASNQLDKAVSFCQKGQFDEPLYYAALSFYQLGQKDKSEARLEEIIKMYPDGTYVEKARSTLELIKR